MLYVEHFNHKIMHYIQGVNRAEIKLFPEVENWVSENNPVRLIDESTPKSNKK